MREEYLPRVPSPADASPYIAHLGDRPVGFVQSYVAMDSGNGWWEGYHDPSVRGMDLFIGNAEDLGRGLGTALVSQFADYLFRDPAVTRIIIDPDPRNIRAIRCYARAGFTRVGEIRTPDGPALLMELKRPDPSPLEATT